MTTTTDAPAVASTDRPGSLRRVSAVPYLPGLDGLRAVAVVAVMVYHANAAWLPGGFLGVEVFFVISGYLITLLLIGEHERSGRVRVGQFYVRRARRLLPALYTMLVLLTVYTAVFRRDALGQLRGDVIAGLTYVSNWYQIWIGQGYTATGDFAPLRHLWSLAVEEQFYLLWPLVMIVILRRGSRRGPGRQLVARRRRDRHRRGRRAALPAGPDRAVRRHARCVLAGRRALLLQGRRAVPVDADAGRGAVARRRARHGLAAGGVDARPDAPARSGARRRRRARAGRPRRADAGTLHVTTPDGADPWLFRGGFVLTALATLAVIAAVTHRGTWIGPALGNALFVWIGTRSYGLYLYHWPIYQGDPARRREHVVAPRVRRGDGRHARRDRAVVPPRRDADPPRHVQAVVAGAAAQRRRRGPASGRRDRRDRHRRRRVRRRQPADGAGRAERDRRRARTTAAGVRRRPVRVDDGRAEARVGPADDRGAHVGGAVDGGALDRRRRRPWWRRPSRRPWRPCRRRRPSPRRRRPSSRPPRRRPRRPCRSATRARRRRSAAYAVGDSVMLGAAGEPRRRAGSASTPCSHGRSSAASTR